MPNASIPNLAVMLVTHKLRPGTPLRTNSDSSNCCDEAGDKLG